jgi:hypothetical protein
MMNATSDEFTENNTNIDEGQKKLSNIFQTSLSKSKALFEPIKSFLRLSSSDELQSSKEGFLAAITQIVNDAPSDVLSTDYKRELLATPLPFNLFFNIFRWSFITKYCFVRRLVLMNRYGSDTLSFSEKLDSLIEELRKPTHQLNIEVANLSENDYIEIQNTPKLCFNSDKYVSILLLIVSFYLLL